MSWPISLYTKWSRDWHISVLLTCSTFSHLQVHSQAHLLRAHVFLFWIVSIHSLGFCLDIISFKSLPKSNYISHKCLCIKVCSTPPFWHGHNVLRFALQTGWFLVTALSFLLSLPGCHSYIISTWLKHSSIKWLMDHFGK